MSDLQHDFPKDLKDRAADLIVCLRFSTRLPIPRLAFEPPLADVSLAASAAMLPVAGALIGCVGAVILWLCIRLGLPSPLAALLSIGSLIVLTGALHEDGVADFADSLGGASVEQRLTIMKDSRIGTFGSLALILVTLGRVASLDMLTVHSLWLACTVLVSAGAISRCLALLPLYMLDPARSDGLGATSSIGETDLIIAGVLTTVIALLPLLAGAGLGRIIIALILCGLAAYGVTLWTRRLIAGQTGDVAGAIQQVTELMAYLVFTAHP
ncbi:MAG: adenosylcobinamide-GDP ribazoletransferase [Methylovirgula sp.]